MKKIILALLIAAVPSATYCQAPLDHFKIQYGILAATIGVSKQLVELIKDKEARKLSWGAKARRIGETAFAYFVSGMLTGAYLEAVFANCRMVTSIKTDNIDLEYFKTQTERTLPRDATAYELLGISQNASRRDIEQANKRLQRKFHPDKNSNPKAAVISAALNDARDKLLRR